MAIDRERLNHALALFKQMSESEQEVFLFLAEAARNPVTEPKRRGRPPGKRGKRNATASNVPEV